MTNIIRHEYDGVEIFQRASDGYVNITQMAKAGKKRVNNYFENKETKEYLEGLSADTGIPAMYHGDTKHMPEGGYLVEIRQTGTFVHPEVAIDFAQWVSVPFRIWANRTLRKVIEGEAKPVPAIQHYTNRVLDIKKHLKKPSGTWCVIEHCAHVLLEVESAGYPVGQFDLLDGSVGKHWVNYRAEKGITNPIYKAEYKLSHFNGVTPNAFLFEELGVFREWLETVYIPSLMPKYLDKKYKGIVKA